MGQDDVREDERNATGSREEVNELAGRGAADSIDVERARSSEVIRALRYRGDEVQFGRVLAAICRDPGTAHEFVEILLRRVRDGHPDAAVRPLPAHVSCT